MLKERRHGAKPVRRVGDDGGRQAVEGIIGFTLLPSRKIQTRKLENQATYTKQRLPDTEQAVQW